jgi:hypothetical protein
MLLSDFPENKVFSRNDMDTILQTCRAFGGTANNAPRIEVSPGVVSLALHGGFHFTVEQRLVRTRHRTYRNGKEIGSHIDRHQGFRVWIYIGGDEVACEDKVGLEELLAYCFYMMVRQTAQNIAVNIIESNMEKG